jgi:hypothetical protein
VTRTGAPCCPSDSVTRETAIIVSSSLADRCGLSLPGQFVSALPSHRVSAERSPLCTASSVPPRLRQMIDACSVPIIAPNAESLRLAEIVEPAATVPLLGAEHAAPHGIYPAMGRGCRWASAVGLEGGSAASRGVHRAAHDSESLRAQHRRSGSLERLVSVEGAVPHRYANFENEGIRLVRTLLTPSTRSLHSRAGLSGH